MELGFAGFEGADLGAERADGGLGVGEERGCVVEGSGWWTWSDGDWLLPGGFVDVGDVELGGCDFA